MKTINKVTGVIFGVSLMLASGAILANEKQADNDSEANARGIEKSDIKRGMKIEKQKAPQASDPIPDIDITVSQAEKNLQDGDAKHAGDPIPGIDITVNQGHSVCQSGSEGCDDGNESADHVVQQRGGAKFKAGKALAETVKSVDNGGDVKHVDQDSDDDGFDDQ